MEQNQVATLIKEGLILHQQSKFKEAQVIYEQILVIQAYHFDALNLLGLLSAQTKQFQKAVVFLTKALEIKPEHADAYSNRGVALQELGRLDEALASYEQAIRLKPDHADAYSNRGIILKALGRLDEALASYEQAIRLKPDHADANFNRAVVLKTLGRLDEALASYEQAIRLKPEHADAYSNRGVALQELGRLDEALASYEQAIRLKPDYADAHSNRGVVLKTLGRLDEALASCEQAIRLKPEHADAYSNRGIILKALGRLDEALASYEQAIRLKPDYADAHSNRGVALQELGRLDEALASCEQAIRLKPEHAGAYTNRSIVLKALGRLDEALASCEQAIRLKPEHADAYSNRGIVLKALGRLDEALASYDQAIRLKPEHADAHWNLSLGHLLGGNFRGGWQEYEWGWENNQRSPKRTFPQPLWLGVEPLKDKTILLYAEQGLGDTIQFCRYAPLVAQLGAKVILEVQRPLVTLLKNLEGISETISQGDKLPTFDYQCPLLSLPLAFKTELQSIPPVALQITSDSKKLVKWQTQLGVKTKTRIGLVWSSVSNFKNDQARSITLLELLKALPNEGFEYICLQKDIKATDKEVLEANPQIQFFGDQFEDFTDTAALIKSVDLVISTCTSVPHLSCSLGKETWLLLSYVPDWRWLLDRDDSPWYPSVKLYRQEKINNWEGILEKVKADLEKLLN